MKPTKRPNFFIVGAPKSGTTALNHYLSTHPDVFVAKKEMHFFGSDLQFGPRLQLYRRYPEEYLAEFDGWSHQTCAGEASVWYLFSKRAASEIKSFNPDSRIIIMLREPTAMLYSLYHAFVADGNECLPTFKDALDAEPDRRAGRRLSRQTYLAQALAYRAVARVSEQVKRYFDVFGRERVRVIIYDDFSSQTTDVFRKSLEFLGVDPNYNGTKFDVINGNTNGNECVRSAALRAVLNDPLLRSTAVALRSWLPHGIFTAMKKTWLRVHDFNFVNSPSKRRPIDPELQEALSREFAPEVVRLSELLGRDLTYWSRPAGDFQPAARTSPAQVLPDTAENAGLEPA
jgi:hypothetical protein